MCETFCFWFSTIKPNPLFLFCSLFLKRWGENVLWQFLFLGPFTAVFPSYNPNLLCFFPPHSLPFAHYVSSVHTTTTQLCTSPHLPVTMSTMSPNTCVTLWYYYISNNANRTYIHICVVDLTTLHTWLPVQDEKYQVVSVHIYISVTLYGSFYVHTKASWIYA